MNDNYLWDKSGEPDPDIEQLERTLGNLRHKAPEKPLSLPVVSRPIFRFRLNRMSAIAAGIVILLLAGGLWLSLRPSATLPKPEVVSGPPPRTGPIDTTATGPKQDERGDTPDKAVAVSPNVNDRVQKPRRHELAREPLRANAGIRREQQLARKGELAKEQLIKALLITSEKLNAVQKKIQGGQERQPIS